MNNKIIIGLFLLVMAAHAQAQIDSSLLHRTSPDSANKQLNMDAIYQRPFLKYGKVPIAIGGYAEANWQHLGTDGISEGHQFQMRRMTIFLSSRLARNLQFMTEIEFEEGGREIAIEFASIDLSLHPLLNLRGGIVMNPIGAFNQNHDGPKWEFTERPISATEMLPATWSNAGFGIFGKEHRGDWMFGYEFYLTGGFDNAIIDNSENRTFLAASKENEERFEESASGTPLYTGKLALEHKIAGELGLSYMGGIYNTFEEDGIVLDKRRTVQAVAIDYNHRIPAWKTNVSSEWAWIFVDVPETYTQEYGNQQMGGFIDIVQPVLSRKMLFWEEASLNLACRLEYVDWNLGEFSGSGRSIGDEIWSITPALSFRPVPQTVLRLNYHILRHRDLVNNAPSKTGGFSLGISSYF